MDLLSALLIDWTAFYNGAFARVQINVQIRATKQYGTHQTYHCRKMMVPYKLEANQRIL